MGINIFKIRDRCLKFATYFFVLACQDLYACQWLSVAVLVGARFVLAKVISVSAE
jgi:hypothetical protein